VLVESGASVWSLVWGSFGSLFLLDLLASVAGVERVWAVVWTVLLATGWGGSSLGLVGIVLAIFLVGSCGDRFFIRSGMAGVLCAKVFFFIYLFIYCLLFLFYLGKCVVLCG